jgi:hypothetical protein
MSSDIGRYARSVGKAVLFLIAPPYAAYKVGEFLYDGAQAADRDRTIAIAKGAPLALFGCSSEHAARKEDPCRDPNADPDLQVLDGETMYQSGDYTVIQPQGLNPGIADYYLSQLANCTAFVRQSLNLDTPHRKLSFIMRKEDPVSFSCNGADMCNPLNEIWHPMIEGMADGDIDSMNNRFLRGGYASVGVCEEPTIAHELSHLLRFGVASFRIKTDTGAFPFTSMIVEEGLARYTESAVTRAAYERSTSTCDLIEHTPALLAGSDFLLKVSDGGPFMKAHIGEIGADGVVMEYSAYDGTRVSAFISFTDGGVLEGYPLGLWATKLSGPAGEELVTLNVYDLTMPNAGIIDYEPGDTGYSTLARYRTADGTIVHRSQILPYGDIDLYAREGVYIIGVLFWNAMRDAYGAEKVNELLNVIASIHRNENNRPFSLLEVFVQVMGVGTDEARAFFTRFQISPDALYSGGDLCWNQDPSSASATSSAFSRAAMA